MSDIHRDDLVARYKETERRISALERQPMTEDLPHQLHPYQNYDSTGRALPITWPDWVYCFYATFPVCLYPAWQVTVHVLTPAATTAEVRLTNAVVGGAISVVKSIAAGTDYFFTYKWLHGQVLGTGPFVPSVECRRTSGTGTVQCFNPITPVLMTQQSVNALGGYTTTG